MFDPNDLEFVDVYAEEQGEELGIDYLGASFPDADGTTQTTSVISPLGERKNNIRMASRGICKQFAPQGVKAIIFKMTDGTSFTLAISRME